MPTPDVDVERMVGTLLRYEVEFVVIGGFAAELWDVAIPPTRDIDVTPEPSPANLGRLCTALNELGAKLRISGSEPLAVPGGLTPELLSQMSILNLATHAGPLDIRVTPAGTSGFDDLSKNATQLEYGSLRVPTADLRDVARSKEAAGREKDLRTLPAILAHLRRQRA
ncbi:MAG: hypothetical protein M3N51_01405 [Actinomycetota bacterium]|nr:hypothetical protein [Actinomycetota bacterium]